MIETAYHRINIRIIVLFIIKIKYSKKRSLLKVSRLLYLNENLS